MRTLRGDGELGERLVDEEVRWDEPLRLSRAHPLQLSVELARELRKAADVSLGIGGVFDGMVGIEKLRCVDVGADILDHDIGRLAPAIAGDRIVAVREGKTFHGRAVSASHHFDAGANREGEAALVECFDTCEISFDGRRKSPLTGRRTIAQLRAELGSAPDIKAKAGRIRWIKTKEVFGDGVQ